MRRAPRNGLPQVRSDDVLLGLEELIDRAEVGSHRTGRLAAVRLGVPRARLVPGRLGTVASSGVVGQMALVWWALLAAPEPRAPESVAVGVAAASVYQPTLASTRTTQVLPPKYRSAS